jgi:type IV secretory pathway VirB4 component
MNQIKRSLKTINMYIEVIEGFELRKLYTLPENIKEEEDYWIYGNQYRRTYIILDYPRTAYPNFLSPIINFPHPVEITQHLHPFPKDKIIHSLELSVSKLESTMNVQESTGRASSETSVRLDDAKDLLSRLASGKDSIIETGFYVTIAANSLLELNNISYEMEGALRQIQAKYRRAMKDNNKAIISSLMLCEDRLMEDNYTFDANSLSRLVPFTAQDYTSGGLLYGINEDLAELITFDVWDLPNANKALIGASGFGKSTFAKLEVGRNISDGTQAFVIDHRREYATLCQKFGGQYVNPGDKVNWNNQFIVFAGENKVKDLYTIWNHIVANNTVPRLLTIEEVHNLLKEDKSLLLDIMREIRKNYVSPTLITPNAKEFLRSDEGQMIYDNCYMKFLMNQGDNDMEEMQRLFGLSKEEKLYLKTCPEGHGYLYTKLFKSKFRVVYSPKEHQILTTRPKERNA